MRVAFMYAGKDENKLFPGLPAREVVLADAFVAGVQECGDEAYSFQASVKEPIPKADVICMVGVKSAKHFRRFRDAGKSIVMFDKGYARWRGPQRTWEYWRVAVNTHHPTAYLMSLSRNSVRWDDLRRQRKIKVGNWREIGNHIVYAGSSAKYHDFVGIEEPTEYARGIIKRLKALTDRPIIYRPKPTWRAAVPVKGATFSPPTQSISDVLENAWCLVTHGSNACFEAVLQGVPTVVLGQAIARPISSTTIESVNDPYLATDDERTQWLSNIAWCQFTEDEMRSGLAWGAIRDQVTT